MKKIFITLLKTFWRIAVGLVVIALWFFHLALRLISVVKDFGRSRGRIKQGTIYCRNGHAVPTEHTSFLIECSACSYVYSNEDGSLWLCPFCSAVTPHVRCGTCSVSVANPYRWG